jgi:hypothetical protein
MFDMLSLKFSAQLNIAQSHVCAHGAKINRALNILVLYFEGKGSILFLKNGLEKSAEKAIKIISKVRIMKYVHVQP